MAADLVCFSQLRWNFVYQRPHHLMSRAARERRVFYVEEVRLTKRARPYIRQLTTPEGVVVCTPYLPERTQRFGLPRGRHASPQQLAGRTRRNDRVFRALIDELLARNEIRRPILWYFTPLFEPVTRDLGPLLTVYDCMDQLTAFKGAPGSLRRHESALLRRTDLVFTGGFSLYESKRRRHPRVAAFPSAVDAPHFARALRSPAEPAELAEIPRPRLVYVGVIDERLDRPLLAELALKRPAWHWVLIGPVVKIRRKSLPEAANIHYLGKKRYADLPDYLAHADVAVMPFALTRATRHISPTKTLEYLAAGLPVVSTPIRDVVRSYADTAVVQVAEGGAEFLAACERALEDGGPRARAGVTALVERMSWDATWAGMDAMIRGALADGSRAARRGSEPWRRAYPTAREAIPVEPPSLVAAGQRS